MDSQQNQLFFYPFLPFHFPLMPLSQVPFFPANELAVYGWKNSNISTEAMLCSTENQFRSPQRPSTVKVEESTPAPGSLELRRQGAKKKSSCVASQRRGDPAAAITENRNILPNITSNVLSYVRRINRSGRVVERIIQRYRGENLEQKFTVKKFYAYQFYLKENITDFKGKDGIEVLISCCDQDCSCFSLEEQLFYNKVCRVLAWQYLNHEIYSDVLSSNRLSPRNRKDYLKVKRYLQDILRGRPRVDGPVKPL